MRQRLLGALLVLSNLCVALYWLSQSHGGPEHGDATVGSALADLRAAALLAARRHMGRLEPVSLLRGAANRGRDLLSAVRIGILWHPLGGAPFSKVLAALYLVARWVGSLRLRLLLPRGSYASAAAALLCAGLLPRRRLSLNRAASPSEYSDIQVRCRPLRHRGSNVHIYNSCVSFEPLCLK